MQDDESMTVGERIGRWRRFRHMSQQKLADVIDLTPSSMSRIEANKQTITVPVLERIAKALRVELHTFYAKTPKLQKRA
jgi:transcriptional regulator with XRE-family HTH domain